MGVPPAGVVVDQVGLNHLTWVRAVWVDERDVLPDLLEAHGEAIAAEIELPAGLLRELGAVPSYYLRYFYAHDEVLGEQLAGVPRAEVVAEIERELLELYRDPALVEKPALLEQRGGAYYSEAATALVGSLFADTGDVQVVDIRNGSTRPGLAPDDVVEVPARIGRVRARAARPAAACARAARPRPARCRLRAADGRGGGDAATRPWPAEALLAHPLIGQYETAGLLLEPLAAAETSG